MDPTLRTSESGGRCKRHAAAVLVQAPGAKLVQEACSSRLLIAYGNAGSEQCFWQAACQAALSKALHLPPVIKPRNSSLSSFLYCSITGPAEQRMQVARLTSAVPFPEIRGEARMGSRCGGCCTCSKMA